MNRRIFFSTVAGSVVAAVSTDPTTAGVRQFKTPFIAVSTPRQEPNRFWEAIIAADNKTAGYRALRMQSRQDWKF